MILVGKKTNNLDLGTLVRLKKKELNPNLDYDLQGARRLKRGLSVNKRQKIQPQTHGQ